MAILLILGVGNGEGMKKGRFFLYYSHIVTTLESGIMIVIIKIIV